MLHIAPDGCDASCTDALATTRQVRTALGHKAERVNRALIGSGFSADEHPDLFVAAPGSVSELLDSFGEGASESVWLIDPLGNKVLRYPVDTPPGHFRDDIKKLLKKSRIG